MGKILSGFGLNWPGTISRAVDDIVVSLKNSGADPIPFGAPVFLAEDGDGVAAFIPNGSQTFDRFVGFAARSASKTPDTYPAGQDLSPVAGEQSGEWNPGEVVEVLVRGTIAIRTAPGFLPGGSVWIRKSDGVLVCAAGTEGSTLLLENVKIRVPQQSGRNCSEAVVLTRNIQ